MTSDHSIRFFDSQFCRQIAAHENALNPFEIAALPHLCGHVLDFGCGMGNLSLAAARQGCNVVALDGSPAAIEHLRQRAAAEGLAIEARVADLREFVVTDTFDAVVSIGLLMCFDRPTARRCLANLQAQVRAGGVAVVNVLVEGTTYTDILDPGSHCLFARGELQNVFSGWDILAADYSDFDAPRSLRKSFITVIARKPPER